MRSEADTGRQANGAVLRHAPAHGRVLLAENDDEVRGLLADLLQADGHEVVEVASGREMLRVLRSSARGEGHHDGPCDVIVTDHLMPNGDGLDAIEVLRRAGWATPVLLITAFADEHLRTKADDLETMVMAKPFPIPAFRSAVSVLLSLRPPGRGEPTPAP